MANDSLTNPCTRRVFAGLAGASILVRSAHVHATHPSGPSFGEKAVGAMGELEVGASKDFSYPSEADDEAFLVRLDRAALGGVGPGNDHVAFLRACPHMGAPLTMIDSATATIGPCVFHRSRFDLAAAGRQIIGRACQRLVQVRLELRSATIYAVGLDGARYGQALEER